MSAGEKQTPDGNNKAHRDWTGEIDPASIPDSVLMSEFQRRRAAKRKTYGAGTGRPKVLRACPGCGALFGATEMREHQPRCLGGHE
jgi:hypothetical protein